MRKIWSLAMLALAIGGCATDTISQYGNFLPPTMLDQQRLATDAVQQLTTIHPPAFTRLGLQQPTPDPFGQALVKSLRDKGYALVEFVPASAASQPGGGDPGDLRLRYVIDQAGDLYRVTVIVGHQSITRPYVAQSGTFVPAGYWARKE